MAHGMLLNVMLSMRAPEHARREPALAELAVCAFGEPCPRHPVTARPGWTHPVLASASPARLATLRRAGVEPVVIVSGVDEDQLDGLPPAELALQLAELKCAAVAARDDLPADASCSAATRCSSSTARRWASRPTPTRRPGAGSRCAGRSGVLHTGHSLRDTATGHVASATASTTVHFADVSDEEIAAYVATGEPLHVAGAFTVDGLGGAFVTGIEGDHHNVVGGQPAAAPGAGGGAGRLVDRPVGPGSRLADRSGESPSGCSSVVDAGRRARRRSRTMLIGRWNTKVAEQRRTGRRQAEHQADHVGRDVVRDRVVETEHVTADRQAADRDQHGEQVDHDERDEPAVRGHRRPVPERPVPAAVEADHHADALAIT